MYSSNGTMAKCWGPTYSSPTHDLLVTYSWPTRGLLVTYPWPTRDLLVTYS